MSKSGKILGATVVREDTTATLWHPYIREHAESTTKAQIKMSVHARNDSIAIGRQMAVHVVRFLC